MIEKIPFTLRPRSMKHLFRSGRQYRNSFRKLQSIQNVLSGLNGAEAFAEPPYFFARASGFTMLVGLPAAKATM